MYQKNTENGYITSLVSGASDGNITQEEYQALLAVIRAKPAADAGYAYRLRGDLTWEAVEAPVLPPEDEDAGEEDYRRALSRLGVNTDEEV